MSTTPCAKLRMPWCNMKVGLKDVHFKNQDIPQLRSELLLSGELFEDPCFPADQSSLGDVPIEDVEWKRPKELCANPQLFASAPTQAGVKPGKFSSPWVVSAISVLGGMRELFYMVMPDSRMQEWRDDPSYEYLGLFYFCFWHFGTWTFVIVDDRLPTVRGELIFTQSTDKGEFWVPLLEKAYAKLHGSYQKLDFGHVTDALVDFTGGVAETYDLNINEEDPTAQLNNLMETISHELSSHSIICLKINTRHVEEETNRNEIGLTRGAVYQINGAKYISLGETRLQNIFSNRNRIGMIRLRGTPPDDAGVSGSPVSQKSSESFAYSASMLARLLSRNPKWAQVRESEQQRMGLNFDHSGEFWMPLDDLIVFNEVVIVHFFTKNAYALRVRWKEASLLGHWTVGAKGTSTDRAGGCSEFQETFLRNPQYAFDVQKQEENIIIQLLQWSGPAKAKFISDEILPSLIGFCIIKAEENRCYRLSQQWEFNPTAVTVQPVRKRQLYYCGTLARGRYIIIPYTYKPGEEAGFMLRLFAKSNINLRELKLSGPVQHWPKFLFRYPSLTTVIVLGTLNNLACTKGSDLWIQLKCEGKTAKTITSQDSSHPKWNSAFVFYRANPEKPISVKLYSRKWQCFHTLLGRAELPAVVNRSLSPLEVTLRDKKGEPTTTVLSLRVLTIDSILCV